MGMFSPLSITIMIRPFTRIIWAFSTFVVQMLWCNGELQYYLHRRHLRVSQQEVQYTNALSVGRMSLPVRVVVTKRVYTISDILQHFLVLQPLKLTNIARIIRYYR